MTKFKPGDYVVCINEGNKDEWKTILYKTYKIEYIADPYVKLAEFTNERYFRTERFRKKDLTIFNELGD